MSKLYKNYIKRGLDIATSGAAIVLLSPVLLTTTLLVRKKLGSPVLFKQERPGKDEKIFTMYKFRTMTDERDENGQLLPDENRLTDFGKWLRSTSIDELPELINIFKGDMSLVGPRPLLVQYLPLYNEEQKQRHNVRPGLTGLAQVNGRNAISWDEKFKNDITYIKNISFHQDLKIVLVTFLKAFVKQEGISQEGNATMEIFTGSEI